MIKENKSNDKPHFRAYYLVFPAVFFFAGLYVKYTDIPLIPVWISDAMKGFAHLGIFAAGMFFVIILMGLFFQRNRER